MIAEPPSRRIAVWSGPRNLSTALMRSFSSRACPEGITRAAILELCRRHGQASETRHVPAEELAQADEIFVTGTMGEVTSVVPDSTR